VIYVPQKPCIMLAMTPNFERCHRWAKVIV